MNANTPAPAAPDAPVVVFYDGACPLCRAEIDVYRAADVCGRAAFVDVSHAAPSLPSGLDQDAALARFHVLDADGRLRSGAAGFVALWRQLPGWRWLARLAALPGVTMLLEYGYRLFLPRRPALVRLYTRLARRRGHG